MAIASFFFSRSTPFFSHYNNPSLPPHPTLIFFPFKLKIFTFTTTHFVHTTATAISAHRGGGSSSGSGGGSGNWGSGGGDEDEERDRNREEAMVALAEDGRWLESLPEDLAAAVSAGRVPGSIMRRFFQMEQSVVLRWLLKFRGFRERLLADDLFLAKLLIESGVIIFTKVLLSSNLDFIFCGNILGFLLYVRRLHFNFHSYEWIYIYLSIIASLMRSELVMYTIIRYTFFNNYFLIGFFFFTF